MVQRPMRMSETRRIGRDTDVDGVSGDVGVAANGEVVMAECVDIGDDDGEESGEANKEGSSGKTHVRLLDDAIHISNDSSTHNSTDDMNVVHTPQKKSFKSVVRRHFVKDKLFFLLHDLVESIDDERRAHADLITSFQTAREITLPVRRKSLASGSAPVARRKRRSDVPLLERIEQNRREARVQFEDVTIYSKELATVGQMKVSAKTVEEIETENSTESVDKSENTVQSMKNEMLQDTEKESHKLYNGKATDNVSEKGQDKDVFAKRQRSKSLPAGENERLFAAYQLNRDERTTDIDQLVLNSILPDIERENDNRNVSNDEIDEQPTDGNESESDDCKEDENNHRLAVSVESNTDTDEDESNIQVVGSTDELENEDLDNDAQYDDDDAEFKKLTDPNVYVLTPELNRTQASLQLTLDPIADTSSDSCQSMPLSARESSSVIEIEPKESTLPWRDTTHTSATTVDSTDTNVPNSQDRRLISTTENKFEAIDLDKSNDREAIRSDKRRTNMCVAQAKEQKSRHVLLSVTSGRESQNGQTQIPKYIEYMPANGIDRAVINKVDEDVRSGLHLSKNKQTRQSRQILQFDAPHKYELSNMNEGVISTAEKSKHTGNEEGKKSKHKRERQKKLISIDLVGIYEDNTDLQKIENKETSHSKQRFRKETMKLAQSPKRPRSQSPKKKRAPLSRNYDLAQLSPKAIDTSSDGRRRPLFSVHRSKANRYAHSSSTSSMEDINDSYKKLQTMKNEKRHSKPDFVLWKHLNIRDERTTDTMGRIAWNENHGASSENNNNYSGSTDKDVRHRFDTDSRTVTWNIPITEAIKNIKGSKQVPIMKDLIDTVPREYRVGRLYLDLKHERRTSGYKEYRRMGASERRKDME